MLKMAHSNMARGVEQNVAKQFNRFIRYDYNLKNRSSWTEDQNNVKPGGGLLVIQAMLFCDTVLLSSVKDPE